MAIRKPVVTPHGVDATYHRLLKTEINSTTETVLATVAIYASSEARAAGKEPLWHEYVSIPFAAFTQDPRDLIYPMLTHYGASYLAGGWSDEPGEPGIFSIDLTAEAKGL